MGLNIPDLLFAYMQISPGGVASAQAAMDSARQSGFTYARFIASGFWPVNMTGSHGWVSNPAAFFSAFDALIADARARGLRLIPSLLWNTSLFPDLAQEPMGKLFEPGSTTRNLAEQYITQVVTRYANNDVVLMWELGNETNLLADLDFSTCTVCMGDTPNPCGSVAPSVGTPCRRTAADNFFSCNACRGVSSAQQDLGQFAQSIAQLVKSIDPGKQFSSGFSLPRGSAYHLARSPCPACDWTPDSYAELQSVLTQLHGPDVDVVSVHIYPGDDNLRFGSDDQHGAAMITTVNSLVQQMGKTLYVGEYGEPRGGDIDCGGIESCGGDPAAMATRRMTDAIVVDEVPFSSLWAWDFFQFCANVPSCYTVRDDDPLVSWLSAHEHADGSCTAASDGAPCPVGECSSGICAPKLLWSEPFDLALNGRWLTWTNCSSCTEGDVQATVVSSRSVASLQAHDLPCSGVCQYPGVYALGPAFTVQPGQILVSAVAHVTGTASLRMLFYDSADGELGSSEAAMTTSNGFRMTGLRADVPPGAVTGRVRLELRQANALVEVDRIDVDVRP